MPKISIIIPIFNAEKQITACVNSLLKQTIKDIEVIFVDDHSTDKSIISIKQFLQNQTTSISFKFLETASNVGPGLARNMGIEASTGEYLLFIDADDWVEPTMCESLYKEAVSKNSDISYCNAIAHKGKNSWMLENPTYNGKKHYLTHYKAYLWTYCFRRQFIVENQILFPCERSAEDSYFIACSILLCNKMAKVSKELYHYILYSTSISHKCDFSRYKQKASVFNKLLRFAEKHNLINQYRWQLYYIYLKKVILTSIKDIFLNIKNHIFKKLKIEY